jgi:hypothetical protein
VLVGWAGEWSVGVGWDVFIVENVSVILCEFLSGTAMGLLSCCFSMLQNCFGLYLSMSGSCSCRWARCLLQLSLNVLYACLVWSCFFP